MERKHPCTFVFDKPRKNPEEHGLREIPTPRGEGTVYVETNDLRRASLLKAAERAGIFDVDTKPTTEPTDYTEMGRHATVMTYGLEYTPRRTNKN